MPPTMKLIGNVANAGSGASIEAMMRGGRDDDGVVAAGERLRHGEHHGVAGGKPIVGESINGSARRSRRGGRDKIPEPFL